MRTAPAVGGGGETEALAALAEPRGHRPKVVVLVVKGSEGRVTGPSMRVRDEREGSRGGTVSAMVCAPPLPYPST